MSAEKKKETLSFLSLFQYSFLAFPLGFAGFPIYILAPDFYALNYGIPLWTLGISLLLIRVFDAFQDPLIGMLSDQYRHHILLIMGLSAFILVLSIYSLFNALLFSPLIWFILCMTFSVTAYSVLTINLNSVGGLWFRQEKYHLKVSSVREVFSLIGLLLSVSIPSFLGKITHEDKVYQWFSLVLLALVILGFLEFYFWYRRYSKKFHHKISRSFFYVNHFSSDSKKILCRLFNQYVCLIDSSGAGNFFCS